MTKNTVLIIIAHSDDETFGMGGTIKRHITNGDKVFVISMTDGVSSRDGVKTKEIKKRLYSAKLASSHLGFKWEKNFNFEDNSMDKYPLLEVIKCIEKVKKKIKPTLVYTHSGGDLNIDHRIVVNAVLTAFRPEPKETCKEIRSIEIPSATDFGHESVTGKFSPNLFIEITKTWNSKLLAMKAYKSELKDFPHSRSIENIKNLAYVRGSQAGVKMAEAFQVLRKIEK